MTIFPQEEIEDDQSALFAERPDSLKLDEDACSCGWFLSSSLRVNKSLLLFFPECVAKGSRL